ncbi:helix-turn-helix transcriptional regulator [Pseudomonas veronii]|nr:helix-turn-helix transcriptional regulator [Pseudomonas veronii]NWC59591.1 helix-turn-helix transcriptional regulator [Pseudomonas veronii]
MARVDSVKASLKRSIKFEVRGQKLSAKELEVLKWCCAGKTSWEIALIREVSEATIKFHLKSIYAKLGVSNRAHAVAEAHCQGLLE